MRRMHRRKHTIIRRNIKIRNNKNDKTNTKQMENKQETKTNNNKITK